MIIIIIIILMIIIIIIRVLIIWYKNKIKVYTHSLLNDYNLKRKLAKYLERYHCLEDFLEQKFSTY
jgi:uncharacterized protein YxeA